MKNFKFLIICFAAAALFFAAMAFVLPTFGGWWIIGIGIPMTLTAIVSLAKFLFGSNDQINQALASLLGWAIGGAFAIFVIVPLFL